MGASLMNGGGSGGRGGKRRRYTPQSEINVTPFVDVMLVLLIVFMISAPLLTVGVQVDLPKTKAPAISQAIEPLVVSIDGKGEIFLQETKVLPETLVPRLQAIVKSKPDQKVFVRADGGVEYRRVLEVMGIIRAGGFDKVALVGRPPDPQTSKR